MRLHVRRLFQNNVDWAKKYYNLFIPHFFRKLLFYYGPVVNQYILTSSIYISDPPPSFESLFGKIRRAKAESSGRVDFAKKSCSICTKSGITKWKRFKCCTVLYITVTSTWRHNVFLVLKNNPPPPYLRHVQYCFPIIPMYLRLLYQYIKVQILTKILSEKNYNT